MTSLNFIATVPSQTVTASPINGTAAGDVLIGTVGDDVINGLGGNDLLIGGLGADIIDGGAGIDFVDFIDSSEGVSVNLATGLGSGGDAQGDMFFNIAGVFGSNFDDTLIGDASDNILIGEGGADTFNGGGGFDTVDFSSSNVAVQINLATGLGSGGDAQGDTFSNIESVAGSNFNDTLIGDANDNVFIGGAGADIFDGGAGSDAVDFATVETGITFNNGVGSGGEAQGDTFTNIESIFGSAFADSFTLGADDELLILAGAGDDIITNTNTAATTLSILAGELGNDTITNNLGAVADVLDGGAGNDTITNSGALTGGSFNSILGGAGDDLITNSGLVAGLIDAEAGNDTIIISGAVAGGISGGAGNDRIIDSALVNNVDGGAGVDTLVLSEGFGNIGLANGSTTALSIGASDTGLENGSFSGFEFLEVEGLTFSIDTSTLSRAITNADQGNQVVLSNAGELVAISGNDGQVLGLAGNDFLTSSDADHNLIGGVGQDFLVGNGGDDVLAGDTPFALTSVEGDIFRAFQAVFDRAPDLGGFNAFVQEVRLGNLDQESVIAEFVDSAEFQSTFGTLDNNAFIEQLFLNVFDREASLADVNAFAGTLNAGRERANVVVELANSAEFVQLTTGAGAAFATNVIFNPLEGEVYRVYQATLGRAPDEAGFLQFTNSIAAGVLTLEDVIEEFIDSPEFISTIGGSDISNAVFVENLFTNVLPGNQDQVGRAAFTASLDSGNQSRVDVVEEFVNSLEFRNATNQDTLEFVRQVDNSGSNDILFGGAQDDVLIGGVGDDTFIFSTEFSDSDIIADFVAGNAGGDIIRILDNDDFSNFNDVLAAASQNGADVVFDFGQGNVLTLNNVTLGDLNAGDFEFLGDGASTIAAAPSASPSLGAFDEFAFEEAEPVDVVDVLF